MGRFKAATRREPGLLQGQGGPLREVKGDPESRSIRRPQRPSAFRKHNKRGKKKGKTSKNLKRNNLDVSQDSKQEDDVLEGHEEEEEEKRIDK